MDIYNSIQKTERVPEESTLNNSQLPRDTPKRTEVTKEIRICLIVVGSLLVLSILIIVIAFVVIPVVFMFSIQFQRFAMFPSIADPRADYKNTEMYGQGIRNFYVTTDETENVVLGVWHLLPHSLVDTLKENNSYDYEGALKNKTYNVIVYFHGNSGNRISPWNTYDVLREFFHVITFDYRGYGDSTYALMSEENVVKDCMELYKWLLNKTENNTIYIWGHSLGSALATHTVAKLHCLGIMPFGLFLEAPFNNMAEEVIYHPMGKILSWLPWFKQTIINPLMNNGFKFETDKMIAMVDCPVLILNAEDDDTVPSFLVKKLLIAAQDIRNLTYQGPVLHHEFPKHLGYSHQYIHRAPDLPNFIRGFIEECKAFAKLKV